MQAKVRQSRVFAHQLFIAVAFGDEECLVLVLVLAVLFLLVFIIFLGVITLLTRFLGICARRLHGEDSSCANVLHAELLQNSFADASQLDLGQHFDDVVVNLLFRIDLAVLSIISLLNFRLGRGVGLVFLLLSLIFIVIFAFMIACRRCVWETGILGSVLGLLGESSDSEADFDLFNGLCSAFGSRFLYWLTVSIVLFLADGSLLIALLALRCRALLPGERIRRVFQGRDLAGRLSSELHFKASSVQSIALVAANSS